MSQQITGSISIRFGGKKQSIHSGLKSGVRLTIEIMWYVFIFWWHESNSCVKIQNFLAQKDGSHYTIRKRRRCFMWDNTYFQMDIYMRPSTSKYVMLTCLKMSLSNNWRLNPDATGWFFWNVLQHLTQKRCSHDCHPSWTSPKTLQEIQSTRCTICLKNRNQPTETRGTQNSIVSTDDRLQKGEWILKLPVLLQKLHLLKQGSKTHLRLMYHLQEKMSSRLNDFWREIRPEESRWWVIFC